MHDDVANGQELLDRYISARARLLGPPPPSAAFSSMPESEREPEPQPEPEQPEPDWYPEMWASLVPQPPLPCAAPPDMPFEEKAAIVLAHAPPYNVANPVLRLQRVVARVFGVKVADIVGPRRHANICEPRQLAMAIAVELFPVSFPQVGRRFGGRDHTTVIHAHRKYRELVREIESGRAA
jgi:hypothetical protein